MSANSSCLSGLSGGLLDLEVYFEQHRVPAAGREFVQKALTGPPVRRVRSGGGNVPVRFASHKMGCVIQAESRTIELAFVEYCEYTPEVVLYLCQPGELYVRITDSRGRQRRVRHVPDYLVLDERGFSLVECKPVDKLERDAASANPKFTRDDSGWRWPAAETAAAELGLTYRVFSSEKINAIWLRNTRFFSDYVEVDCPDSGLVQTVMEQISEAGAMRVCDALALVDGKPEIVWWLLANGEVLADLQCERVFEVGTSWLYSSMSRMLVARCQRRSAVDPVLFPGICSVRVEPGCILRWDGEPWVVLYRGNEDVVLRRDAVDGEVRAVPVGDFEVLLRSRAIRGEESQAAELMAERRKARIRCASNKDLDDARRRYLLLEEAEKTGAVPTGSSPRSIYRYRQWFREGERQFGSGFAGLVRSYGRRSGTSDLGDAQQQVLEEIVELFAGNESAGRLTAACARLVALCGKRGIDPSPSRETLRRALKRRSLEELARKREGARAAYQLAGPVPRQSTAVPVEPDRVFQIAHVDHVLLDIQLVSGRTGALLGRPWLTLMIDAWSRMPLATSMSFDAPSRVALSEVLLDCVARHRRVPDSLVMDRGSEFQSVDFEVALAFLGVNKVERPASRPRFGAVMERMFGITNTAFIHELKGNTRLAQRGRNLSSTHHPTRHAAWTLPRLHEVCESFLFEVYPDLIHGTLGVTRRQAFDHSVAHSGERVARYVPFDDDLRMLLALTPQRPTRKVDSVRGITVDHLRYWHEAFETGDVAGCNVPVKLDPMDCSVLFAQVHGEWVTCRLADGDADLGGRSWKQARLAVQELRGQRRVGAQGRQDNARVLGDFLLETDVKGDLARQVDRDDEAQAVRSARPGGMGSSALRLVKDEPPEEPLAASYSSTPVVLAPDDDDALEGVEPCDSMA